MLSNELNDLMLRLGSEAGAALEAAYPRVSAIPDEPQDEFGPGLIPHTGVEDVAEGLTTLISEALQCWLDAGSEREVTAEELGPQIAEHLKGWSDHPDNDPANNQAQYTDEEYAELRAAALKLKGLMVMSDRGANKTRLMLDLSLMLDEDLDEY